MSFPSRPRAQLGLAAALLAFLAAWIACFPPQRYGFYPSCPVHEWLGLQCPGCGLTRAVADLLSGRLRDALGHNALVVGLLPFAAALALVECYSVVRWNRWRPVRIGHFSMSVAYAVVVMFGVARNL